MPDPVSPLPMFRHIVFPRERSRRKRVVNFASPGDAHQPAADSDVVAGDGNPAFFQWLFQQVGLDARHYRAETLRRRLPACLRVLRVRSAAEARRLVENDASLIEPAVNAMLVGVTSFFRDGPVYQCLLSKRCRR